MSTASAETLSLTGASVYDINSAGNYVGNGWDTTGGNGAANLYLLTAQNDAGSFINSGNGAATSIHQDLSSPGTYTYYFRADGGGFNWPTPSAGLNLFFNGVNVPGISAFVPFNTVSPTPAAYGNGGLGIINADEVPGANSLSFSSGKTTVTLSNFTWFDYRNPAAPNAVPDLVNVFGNTPNGLNDYSGSFTVRVAAVPEPEQWAMMLGGISLLAAFGKRRRKLAAK
ncbi:PEP-CTERM sorting domain-containing protein [Duganella sp. BJB475]|nr:PEP-CTERM sorting domain-containing protein [Duganella sp. BJB475]RFP35953.1 PEP-CTERM sorting domain-containing protein [Duganella sp. BJB476]